MSEEGIAIAGAGPAGLAAAITLARAGARVTVHEACGQVGHRFQGDLQGLENWSSGEDVLAEFERLGITTGFVRVPCRAGSGFDASGTRHRIRGRAPLLYLVERGPGPGALDSALLEQALGLGVEVRFRHRVRGGAGILATGPRVPNAIAVGYHFETAMDDGFSIICDDALAPGGYAYVVTMRGRGTVKTCLFSDFRRKDLYVRRTAAAFERLVGLRMTRPRPHGGIASFRIPASALCGGAPAAGERAGFQDMLFGFGIRYAVVSGVLAARSLLRGEDYDALWRRQFGPMLATGAVNRMLYRSFGAPGYRWLLRALDRSSDARQFLQRLYGPSFAKRLLLRFTAAGQEAALPA